MSRQPTKGNHRVNWGSLSPLLAREEWERATHKGVALLGQLQSGGMLAIRSSCIYARAVQLVPHGVLLTLDILR